MAWVLVVGIVWALLACCAAFLVARAVYLADQRSPHGLVDLDRLAVPSEPPRAVTSRRPRLPGPRRPTRRRAGTPVG